MRALLRLAYLVMAIWIIVSSVLRVLILVSTGSALDPLPFVGAALGVVALAALAFSRGTRPRNDAPLRHQGGAPDQR